MSAALLAAVEAYLDREGGGRQGYFPSRIDAVRVLHAFSAFEPNHRVYGPSLCVVLRGAKQINFGDGSLDYHAMQCLVVSVDLPASGRILTASENEPFISITIDFDIAILREVLAQMDTLPQGSAEWGPGPFIAEVDTVLADCITRIFRTLETPPAIPILYPAIMREICYWLLSGTQGARMRELVLPQTHTERIVNVIAVMRDDFAKTLRVEQLAEIARMSPSSFHQHFKALTAMTPLQYQKQLRLIEARRLMVSGAATVTEAAYKVGYESPSQFSREYSRLFGMPPKRSVTELRTASA